MKKPFFYVIFFDLLFLLLLLVSGSLDGALSTAVYYLAFFVPIILALATVKAAGCSVSFPKIRMRKENILLTLPTIAPTLATVFFISWLTSLALSYFGGANTTDVSGNIIRVIFTHAVLTAFLEELLFRYIPLAYLSPYSKWGSVLCSSVLFAIVHCNPYQIPYAFVAGVIFAALDIALDSILPSLMLHFANNLISIIWLRGNGEPSFVKAYIIILVSFAVISLIPIFLFREKYRAKFKGAFQTLREISTENA